MSADTLHTILLLGQYVLAPVAVWAAHRIKRTIVVEVNEYVDQRINGKLDRLVERVAYIEAFISKLEADLKTNPTALKQRKAVARRDSLGRFVSRSSNPKLPKQQW